MEITILLTVAVLIAAADIMMLNVKRWRIAKTDASFDMFIPKGWKQIVGALLMFIMSVGYVLMTELYYERMWAFILKRLFLLFVLWAVAIFDYREMRIPNKLVLCGLALRLLMVLIELFVYFHSLEYYWSKVLLPELIAVGFAVLICGLCILLTRGGLGMGDMKLIMLIGAFLGGEGLLYAMFFTLFFAFVISLILLITKRKSKKDVIPFAPYILIGAYTAMMISGI